MFLRRDDPLPTPAKIKRHEEVEIGIGVRGEGERREAGLLHTNAELFAKLPDERLFGPLAGFDLATGKFP